MFLNNEATTSKDRLRNNIRAHVHLNCTWNLKNWHQPNCVNPVLPLVAGAIHLCYTAKQTWMQSILQLQSCLLRVEEFACCICFSNSFICHCFNNSLGQYATIFFFLDLIIKSKYINTKKSKNIQQTAVLGALTLTSAAWFPISPCPWLAYIVDRLLLNNG